MRPRYLSSPQIEEKRGNTAEEEWRGEKRGEEEKDHQRQKNTNRNGHRESCIPG